MAKKNAVEAESSEQQLSEKEVREGFAKIKEQREKARIRDREYNARPEVKARQKEYTQKAAAKRKALLEAAKKLGLS